MVTTDRIDATPGPRYRGYVQCDEAQARAAYQARYGEQPAECWQDAAGVWHAGPTEGER